MDANLWLFGGWNELSGYLFLNDLWEFNPVSDEWSWMAGGGYEVPCADGNWCHPGIYGMMGVTSQGNTPGARMESAFWTDPSGNFWLFGGYGYDSLGRFGYLSDLWMFDISAKGWAWMGGASTMSNCVVISNGTCSTYRGDSGVYGIQGTGAATNFPGGRMSALSWSDRNGNLWLFGGFGVDGAGAVDHLDDLWAFNLASGQWIWMGGSATAEKASNYGILGVPDASNIPPTREGALAWVDRYGYFWVYGERACADDLWMMNSSNHEWAWMGGQSGDQPCGQTVFGAPGVIAVENNPGSRNDAATWVDANGNFWLFGGSGLNDLWRYVPSATSLPAAITPVFSPGAGTYDAPQVVAISNGMSNATIYYTTDGTTPTTNSSVYRGPLDVVANEQLKAVAVGNNYPSSAVKSAMYVVRTSPPSFSVPSGDYATAQTVTLSDSSPGAIIYYTIGDFNPPTTSSAVYTGPILVSRFTTIEAMAVAPGHGPSKVVTETYFFPPMFALGASATSLTIHSGGQGVVTLTVTPQNGFNLPVSFACENLPASASCAFSPTYVTPDASAVSTQLTITASAQSARMQRDRLRLLPTVAVIFSFGLFGCSQRRGVPLLIVITVTIAGLGAIGGCGGSASSKASGSTPVTTLITVRAGSDPLQKTVTISLTVE